jgi:hypothetical protein
MPRKITSPVQIGCDFEQGDVYENTVNNLGIGREAVELEGDTLITNRAYRRWKASARRSKGQRDQPLLKFKRM